MVHMNFIVQVKKHSMVHSEITSITLIMVHFVQGNLEIICRAAL